MAETIPAKALTHPGEAERRYTNRWWVLTVLTLVYISGFIDRIGMGVLGQSIKVEFGLTDWQLGLLNGIAFSLTYTVLAIPIARLSETSSRITIISAAALIWSAMTAATGLAANFVQLVLLRAGVGAGEAGCTAPSQALIADYFPREQRARALSIYHLGVPVGVLTAGTFGGWAAETWGWRAAFAVLAIPGVLGGLALRFTVMEPKRGMSDGQVAPPGERPSLLDVFLKVCRMPVIVHVTLAMALAIMANAAVKAFTVPYLMREFQVSLGQAGAAFGLFTGVAAIVGTVAGGFLADLLAKRNPAWLTWVPAVSLLLGGPCYAIGLHQPALPAAIAWLSVSAVLMYGYLGSGFAAVHGQVRPTMRATVASLILLVQSLIGFGLGPLIVGFASDLLSPRFFHAGAFEQLCQGAALLSDDRCRAASASGLGAALSLLVILYLWAAAHFYVAGRALHRDRTPSQH